MKHNLHLVKVEKYELCQQSICITFTSCTLFPTINTRAVNSNLLLIYLQLVLLVVELPLQSFALGTGLC